MPKQEEPRTVAQNTLLLKNNNNPQYNKIYENKLLLYNDGNNFEIDRVYAAKLLSFFKDNLMSKQLCETAIYFMEKGCATSVDLIKNLNIPEGTIHAILRKLKKRRTLGNGRKSIKIEIIKGEWEADPEYVVMIEGVRAEGFELAIIRAAKETVPYLFKE